MFCILHEVPKGADGDGWGTGTPGMLHACREGRQKKHVLIPRSGHVKDLAVYLGSSSAGMRSWLLGRSRRRSRLLG